MHIKILLAFLLMAAVSAGKATEISYVVYFTQGTVSKNSKTKLKKGDKILAGESITLADKASVMLVCSNFKVIQLNKKGTFTAKSLMSQCTNDAAGYSSSYFKYVWNEFTHPHGKPETDPGEYMKNVGAVSRGCNTVATGIPVDTLIIGRGNLNIYWNSSFETPTLRIFDVATDGSPLQKTVLQKDVPINMEQVSKALAPGDYYWQVTDAEGNGCERNFLRILDKGAYQLMVDNLLSQVPYSTEAETAFARGFIMQENHLISAAIASYNVAASLEPGNKLYSNTLSKFYATQF